MKQNIKIFVALFVVMSLNGCYEREQPNPSHVNDADIFIESKTFNAGRLPNANGLDIGEIRLGKHKGSERLVFDVYRYDKKHTEQKAKKTGAYVYKYDSQTKRISVILKGYNSFSALEKNKIRSFADSSRIIEKVTLTKKGNNRLRFDINLKQNASIYMFTLKDPARIVVDIKPSL